MSESDEFENPKIIRRSKRVSKRKTTDENEIHVVHKKHTEKKQLKYRKSRKEKITNKPTDNCQFIENLSDCEKEVPPKNKRKKTSVKENVSPIEFTSDSDSEVSFEEVHGDVYDLKDEVTVLTQLIDQKKNSCDVEEVNEPLVLHLNSKKSKSSLSKEALVKRKLKQLIKNSLVNTASLYYANYISFGRFCNRKCDSQNFQLLAISCLSECKIFNSEGSFIGASKMGAYIWDDIFKKMDRFTDDKNEISIDLSTIEYDLLNKKLSINAVNLVLCAAFRYLHLDAKLIISFNTSPLNPKLFNFRNREKPFHIHMELYCPQDDLYRPISMIEFRGNDMCDKVIRKEYYIYSVGFYSTLPMDSGAPYSGRSPKNVSNFYDEDWLDDSAENRLPSDILNRYSDCLSHIIDNDTPVISDRKNNVLVSRDKRYLQRILNGLYEKPIPKVLKLLKKHPLYVLKKDLLKYEVIHPLAESCGKLPNGADIYRRQDLYLCHTRETWIKEAMTVKIGEHPAKLVNARLSMKRKLLLAPTDAPPQSELFGPWQVEPYDPPEAKDGVVPTNEHNNVDLYKPSMLPKGCAHIVIPGVAAIAKELGIHCVGAVVGWTFHGAGWAHPQMYGHVVCKEYVPVLVSAYKERLLHKKEIEAKKRSESALNNWKRFTKGLFIMHRIQGLYMPINEPQSKKGKKPANTTSKRRGKAATNKNVELEEDQLLMTEEHDKLMKEIEQTTTTSDRVNQMLWDSQVPQQTKHDAHFLDESSSDSEKDE